MINYEPTGPANVIERAPDRRRHFENSNNLVALLATCTGDWIEEAAGMSNVENFKKSRVNPSTKLAPCGNQSE